MPPSLTDQMLQEVRGGTAAELVMAVRYDSNPPGPTFIQSLDREILSFRPHPGRSSLQRGDLVELIGPSGSGKTALLMFLLLTTLLPSALELPATTNNLPMTVPLGGRNTSAAYLQPVTHPSPIRTLVDGMNSHIRSCIDGALLDAGLSRRILPEHVQAAGDTVRASLRRLRIMRVRPRYLSWALALRRLLTPVATATDCGEEHPPPGIMPPDELALVVCDGLADGFWPERAAEEERREAKKPNVSSLRNADDVGMRDVMEGIGRLRKELGSVVVVSLQGIFHERHANTSTPSQYYTPALPRPFPAPFVPQSEDFVAVVGTKANDPVHWPLSMELTMLGPPPRMQFPAETVLVDALRARNASRSGMPNDFQSMMARLRIPGNESAGAPWTFSVGADGVEVFAE